MWYIETPWITLFDELTKRPSSSVVGGRDLDHDGGVVDGGVGVGDRPGWL
jgi:hypothetical protein